jgi:hypothetical protein
MTVSENVKSWIREHQPTSNRSAVEEKQTKVCGEEGIREDQPNSVKAMSVICSQTTVSGEGGIHERPGSYSERKVNNGQRLYQSRMSRKPAAFDQRDMRLHRASLQGQGQTTTRKSTLRYGFKAHPDRQLCFIQHFIRQK